MRPIQLTTRVLVYLWASPYTLIGILIGLVSWSNFRWVSGVAEIHGPRVAWVLKRMPVPAAAITLGHCVLGQTAKDLEWTRNHERVHVRQFERWGFLMGPAYLLASFVLFLRGRDYYRENPFEIEAYGSAPLQGDRLIANRRCFHSSDHFR